MNRFEPGHPVNHWLILLKNAAVALNHLFAIIFSYSQSLFGLSAWLKGKTLRALPSRSAKGAWPPLDSRLFGVIGSMILIPASLVLPSWPIARLPIFS
ncbi:MAG: hypothetical protein HFE43_05130 [Oscillospiraceae bacterium]|nr:hypothetical protein [Oscillospiraceae bacterium]